MKALTALCLALASPLAFAATISMDGLVEVVVWLIVIGLVLGLLLLLVRKAPFIPPEWKTGIEYVIYFIVILFVINLLLGLIGHQFISIR